MFHRAVKLICVPPQSNNNSCCGCCWHQDLPASITRELHTAVIKHTNATHSRWTRQGFKIKKIPRKVFVVLTASTLYIYKSDFPDDKDAEAVCYSRLSVPGLLVGVGKDDVVS